MNITGVQIGLPDPRENFRVVTYATLEMDDSLVIHELRLIDGNRGFFVAMPDRKTDVWCDCGSKSPYVAKFCMWCGRSMPRIPLEVRFRDVVHPTNQQLRQQIHDAVVNEYVRLHGDARLHRRPPDPMVDSARSTS